VKAPKVDDWFQPPKGAVFFLHLAPWGEVGRRPGEGAKPMTALLKTDPRNLTPYPPPTTPKDPHPKAYASRRGARD
jgi:hypothetical protein